MRSLDSQSSASESVENSQPSPSRRRRRLHLRRLVRRRRRRRRRWRRRTTAGLLAYAHAVAGAVATNVAAITVCLVQTGGLAGVVAGAARDPRRLFAE